MSKKSEALAKIAALEAELIGYVGEKQAAHSIWMIESSLKCQCLKHEGPAWLREKAHSLVHEMERPRYSVLMQISPETLAWGGFLSHDVSYVPGPSLRQGAAS